MIAQTDGKQNTITYEYNARNLVSSRIDPGGIGDSGKTEKFSYYANGLKKTRKDRNGIMTNYSYDGFGRLILEDNGGEVQSYTYDNNGNMLTMTDASGTTTRTYDSLNRNDSKIVPKIGKTTYEYDLPSDKEGEYLEKTTDPKKNIVTKSYDKVGRLSSVSVGEDKTHYEYADNGRKISVTYPGGVTQNYEYDSNNQITKLINKLADGSIISSYEYTYDEAGNQLTKTEAKGTTIYEYDSLNRLSIVTEPGGKATEYTYDHAGNRYTELVNIGNTSILTRYFYNEQNRLTKTFASTGEETIYIYDKNGNLLSKSTSLSTMKSDELFDTSIDFHKIPNIGIIINRDSNYGTGTKNITTYSYNNYNRMTQMKSKDITASYLYNAQGYRVEKVVNGEVTNYLYEGDKVVLETNKDNKQKAYQVYGANLLYRDVAKTVDLGAQQYYYIYNAHGDVTTLIDANGAIAATYDYDAFGNILSETGNANNSIKYAGYQHDKESGLYYLNARYYESTIARFITEDTYYGEKNDPLSLNLYTYCHNNPIVYWDPSGNTPEDFIYGLLEAVDDNSEYTMYGALRKILGYDKPEYTYESEIDYYAGRVVGHAVSMVGGITGIVKGIKLAYAAIEGGLAVTALTAPAAGLGAPVGVAIAAGGVTIALATVKDGVAATTSAGINLNKDIEILSKAIERADKAGGTETEIKAGEETPKGRKYSKHGAERANERGFDSKKIDDIIDNNKKTRVKEIDEDGRVQWRYQDKRGNTVITNEWSDTVVTVYSYPKSANDLNYIPK